MPSTLAELGAAIIREVDARLGSKVAASAMHLFSNTTANWTSDVFVPNDAFWLKAIRNQLTGVHMYVDGGWMQAYGLTPITRRHGIGAGHNGPGMEEGVDGRHKVRFTGVDGAVFETRISKWINDNSGTGNANIGRVSDAMQQPAEADLSIYRFDDELPESVHIMPIAPVEFSQFWSTYEEPYWDGVTGYKVPSIAISQGSRTDGTATENTPNNRKAYVASGYQVNAQRTAFHHDVTSGDSGCPEFVLCDGILYLYKVNTASIVADQITYLNALIARSQAAASDATEYTVAASELPTLNTAPKRSIPSWKTN
jgi:hypothetical protein